MSQKGQRQRQSASHSHGMTPKGKLGEAPPAKLSGYLGPCGAFSGTRIHCDRVSPGTSPDPDPPGLPGQIRQFTWPLLQTWEAVDMLSARACSPRWVPMFREPTFDSHPFLCAAITSGVTSVILLFLRPTTSLGRRSTAGATIGPSTGNRSMAS